MTTRSSRSPSRQHMLLVVFMLVAVALIGLAPAAQGQGQPAITISGWVTVTWSDTTTQPESAGFSAALGSPNGNRWTLLLDAGLSSNSLLNVNGQYVTVSGTVTPGNVDPTLTVQTIRPARLDGAILAAQPATTTGRWIALLCAFADLPDGEPLGVYQTMMGDAFPGMGDFWREVSYGKVNISGSTAAGWFRLPEPRAAYFPNDQPRIDQERARKDCIAAADSQVDFSQFVGVNLIFNGSRNERDFGPFIGGTERLTLDGVSKVFGVTWMPAMAGFFHHPGLAHEMGHSFGLPHSRDTANPNPYSNPWDLMSDAHCSASFDATYQCLGKHIIAAYKDRLGWLPAERIVTVASGTQTEVTLEALAQLPAANYLMARIPIKGTNRYYTVEARQRMGYDRSLSKDRLVIHEVDPGRPEPAHFIQELPPGFGHFKDATHGIEVCSRGTTASGYTAGIGNGVAVVCPPPPPPDFKASTFRVSLANGARPIGLGDWLLFEATLQNSGVAASNVVVTAGIPDGTAGIFLEQSQGTATGTGPVVFSMGSIDAVGTEWIRIMVRVSTDETSPSVVHWPVVITWDGGSLSTGLDFILNGSGTYLPLLNR